jgi:hypothetical protein
MAQFCRLTLAGPERPGSGKKSFSFRDAVWGALRRANPGSAIRRIKAVKGNPENPELSGMLLRQDKKRDPKERID